MLQYFRPENLQNGLQLLSEQPLTVLSGATDVYPAATAARAWGSGVPDAYLDISAIPELKQIELIDGHWRIGAGVTWRQIARADLPAEFSGLQSAARQVGGAQVQSRGTLAGNICNASPAADGVPPLLCLDAKVVLSSADSRRELPLAAFILGNRRTDLKPGELLTAIHIPESTRSPNGYFYKFGTRAYLVISLVSLAAVVSLDQQRRISTIRVAVGACSAVPVRLIRIEQLLHGQSIDGPLQQLIFDSELPELSPIDDVRATAAWRLSAVREGLAQFIYRWREELSHD